MTETERAKQLAKAHWGYVGGLLESHGVSQELVDGAAYNYTTAFEHAYMHAIEDERGGMFRPSIGEPLTAAEVNAISRPCSACMDEKQCGGGLRTANGQCLHHRPKGFGSCTTCEKAPPLYCAIRINDKAQGCTNYRPAIPDQQHPRKEG